MKRLILSLSLLMILSLGLNLGFAQQSMNLVGTTTTAQPLDANARLGIHLIDNAGARWVEVANTSIIGGTFSISAGPVDASLLDPFLNGISPFPGIINEYTVAPQGVNYIRAITNVYNDGNGNGAFDDPTTDLPYYGIASVAAPKGFFGLIYVDQDAQIIHQDVTLQLRTGWNIFTMRFDEAENVTYSIQSSLSDALLELFQSIDELLQDPDIAPAIPTDSTPADSSEGQ